jgi:hypothetical protein
MSVTRVTIEMLYDSSDGPTRRRWERGFVFTQTGSGHGDGIFFGLSTRPTTGSGGVSQVRETRLHNVRHAAATVLLVLGMVSAP